jgi:hypothetical protein
VKQFVPAPEERSALAGHDDLRLANAEPKKIASSAVRPSADESRTCSRLSGKSLKLERMGFEDSRKDALAHRKGVFLA